MTLPELRPYGPGGAMVCVDCASTPEHQPEAQANFHALIEAAAAASPLGVAIIDNRNSDGPNPFLGELPT